MSTTTILLVDDEPAVCRALSRLLRYLGYKVLIAESGEEAKRIAASEHITLVLSDVQMPDMNGHEVATLFAGRCPVILMSGNIEEQMRGALAKPFSPEELVQQIQSALRIAA